MLSWYQHLPEHINPITISIGSFSIHWYSVMYLVAFAVVYSLLAYRIRKKENLFEINKYQLEDLLIYLIIGLLIGARLGYVIFYNLPYYISNPLEIFLPVQVTGFGLRVTGFYGMSYYGGLIGVILAGWIFAKRKRVNFWQLADFVIPAIPAGYFFGRVGNFFNGELYGRATNVFWGMYFPTDSWGFLRHPSQLYEAFFEGLALFIILWSLRNKLQAKSYELCVYLFGYGFFRFFIEFFRQPDPQIGLISNFFTLGQVFSLIMMVLSLTFYLLTRKRSPHLQK
jgi:phosphatidylglycerol---prolipoprotein diacylglyceryl transferase